MNLDRREFLKTTGAAALGAAFLPGISWAKKAEVSESKRGPHGVGGTFLYSTKEKFHLIDLSSGRTESWGIPNQLSHSVSLAPQGGLAVTIDQDGPSASVVNLRKRSMKTLLSAQMGNWFSGHGTFSSDGAYFYLAEYPRLKKENGSLAIFETKGWRRVATHDTGGIQSHYVQPLRGGKVIAVGHYGRATEGMPLKDGILSLMNSETGKIEEIVKAKNPYHSLCHMDKADDDTLLISTRAWVKLDPNADFRKDRNDPTPVLIGSPWKKNWAEIAPASFADKMRLNFTVKVDSKKREAMVTHLTSDSISLWSLDGGKNLLRTRSFPGETPSGLGSGVGRDLYVMHTLAGRIYFLNPKDLSTAWIMSLHDKLPGFAPHFELTPERYLSAKS